MKTIIIDGIEYNLTPKALFKKGDFVVIKETIYQITKVENLNVTLSLNGKECLFDIDVLKNARLWDIAKDAKDGDVLAYRDGQWIFIYKEKIDDNSFSYYALYSTIHQDLTINDAGFTLLGSSIIPATKEQRDLLFQKMKEAGYTFDFEKKELKKIVAPIFHIGDRVRYKGHSCDGVITEITDTDYICGNAKLPISTQDNLEILEQKPTWSEEDEEIVEALNVYVKNLDIFFSEIKIGDKNIIAKEFRRKVQSWLKSLKDRAQPKQELSESGKNLYNRTIGLLKQYANSDNEVKKQSALSCINWLKSVIKHEKTTKYKIGDKVKFYSAGLVFTISDIDEANERYISPSGDHISFYEELILVKSRINKDDIKCGDYLTTEDGTVIKVHDVDENECVHHFYYASKMTEDGGDISNNFMHYCAILSDCRRATQEEINFLEKWIANKKYVWVKNNVSPYDEEDD